MPIIDTNPMSFDAWRERLKSDVRRAWRAVRDPEGDPRPTVYFYRESTTHMMPLPFEWFSGRASKDELFARIAMMAGVGATERVGLTVITMMLRVPPEMTDEARESNTMPEELLRGHRNLTEHPDSIEMQNVMVWDREVCISEVAAVRRDQRCPPALGPWRDKQHITRGLMVEPIQQALR